MILKPGSHWRIRGIRRINCTNFTMYNSLYICLVRISTDINRAWPNSRINLDNHFEHAFGIKFEAKSFLMTEKYVSPLSFTKLDILKAIWQRYPMRKGHLAGSKQQYVLSILYISRAAMCSKWINVIGLILCLDFKKYSLCALCAGENQAQERDLEQV